MGSFLALIGTLGMGVIIASIIYQVLHNPKGSTPVLQTAQNVETTTVGYLFKG